LANKCPKCGYARNKDEDKSCNLCGQVLGAKATSGPETDSGPKTAGATPGDTVIPEDILADPFAPAPAPAPAGHAAPAEKVAFGSQGLSHLRCSLLEQPLRLNVDKVVTVGRAKESDICVPSQMVSRNHGEFHFEKGVWVYIDLKSANGSRIKGKRVDRHVLQSGDVIDVGGFMITYKEIHDLSDISSTPEDEGKTMAFDPSMLKRAAMQGMEGVAVLGGLGGSLADITIPDILQLCELQRKSGTLSLDFEGALGRIFFRQGNMIHAEYGKLTGEIAVYKMLNKAKGSFHLDPREPKAEQSIMRPTTTVLMDAARYLDEKGKE
jgi:hypothetical protein